MPINYHPAATVVGTKLTIATHVSAWTDPRQAGEYKQSHPVPDIKEKGGRYYEENWYAYKWWRLPGT